MTEMKVWCEKDACILNVGQLCVVRKDGDASQNVKRKGNIEFTLPWGQCTQSGVLTLASTMQMVEKDLCLSGPLVACDIFTT